MAYNINFAAAIKTGDPGNYSKTVDFPVGAAENTFNFRDKLKEAVRSSNLNEIKADDRAALRKELVNRSESKLKSLKKPYSKSDDKVKPAEEREEKKTDKKKMTIEQILSNLEELAKLQQQGEIPKDMQLALSESIQEALKELAALTKGTGQEASSLQTKAAESAAVLEGLMQELKTNGSLADNKAAVDFLTELKAMLTKEQADSGALSKAADISVKPDTGMTGIDDINNEEAKSAKVIDTAAQSPEKNENPMAESKQASEASGSKSQNMKSEAAAAGKKTINNETQHAEENNEDIKAALDSKVEKVEVSGEDNKRQDAEAGNNKEVPKMTNSVNNKPENVDMSAVKQDQAIADNKLDAAQNQAAAKPAAVNKAEIINQIVKKAELVINDSQPEMRMQLEPENLGRLTLKLAVEKGLITAKFVAESYEVKQIIESNFNELKDMLQEKGLEVQSFSVSVGQEGNEYNNSNSFQQWREAVRLNGRSMSRGSYEGYLEGDGTPIKAVNPYSIHNGKFDHRA